MSLHYQNLLKCWWWRRVDVVAIVVLVGTTVASVGHVMIVKRFGTQIDIEIRDSELYASRYIDD
jgi:ABC-type cobalamin transport system permease subunit